MFAGRTASRAWRPVPFCPKGFRSQRKVVLVEAQDVFDLMGRKPPEPIGHLMIHDAPGIAVRQPPSEQPTGADAGSGVEIDHMF